jgi:hypothetical protein
MDDVTDAMSYIDLLVTDVASGRTVFCCPKFSDFIPFSFSVSPCSFLYNSSVSETAACAFCGQMRARLHSLQSCQW